MPKTEFKPKYDLKFRFEINRVAEGSFKNLWQLKIQTPGMKELEEEIDADSLQMCLDRLAYVFEVEGY